MASDREALEIIRELQAASLALLPPENNPWEPEMWTRYETALNLFRKLDLSVALAAPPSAPHDYVALADRLADFRFGSVLKPDGTERDPKEWLAFEPELMRALRDLAAPPSAQDEKLKALLNEPHYKGAPWRAGVGYARGVTMVSTDWYAKLRALAGLPLPPPPAGAPKL